MFVATNRLRTIRGHGHELEERFGRRIGVEREVEALAERDPRKGG